MRANIIKEDVAFRALSHSFDLLFLQYISAATALTYIHENVMKLQKQVTKYYVLFSRVNYQCTLSGCQKTLSG